jgi:hypothetical protein
VGGRAAAGGANELSRFDIRDSGFEITDKAEQRRIKMSMERIIRMVAGTFVLASLALAHWVNPNWLWFTAFVGANLFQSSLTKWCLMEDILDKLGIAKKSTR